MSKFNLYAHEDSVFQRPAFREAAVAERLASARAFALKLGLWFAVIFAAGYMILTA